MQIKDLSASLELDSKAMSAVRGGDNLTNANTMAAAIANETATIVGNGSKFNGSTVFNVDGSSDNDIDQTVDQDNKIKFALDLVRAVAL
jgi:hypothetical protein